MTLVTLTGPCLSIALPFIKDFHILAKISDYPHNIATFFKIPIIPSR